MQLDRQRRSGQRPAQSPRISEGERGDCHAPCPARRVNPGVDPVPDGVNGCPRRGLATTEEGGCPCRVGPRASRIGPVGCDDPAGDRPTLASLKAYSKIGRSMHRQCVGAWGLIERCQSWQANPVPLRTQPDNLPIVRRGDPGRGWAYAPHGRPPLRPNESSSERKARRSGWIALTSPLPGSPCLPIGKNRATPGCERQDPAPFGFPCPIYAGGAGLWRLAW